MAYSNEINDIGYKYAFLTSEFYMRSLFLFRYIMCIGLYVRYLKSYTYEWDEDVMSVV